MAVSETLWPTPRMVADPYAAVLIDVTALRAETRIPGVKVSGLVYDVLTGRIETVVKP